MDDQNQRFLIIDDSTADARVLQALLRRARENSFDLVHHTTAEAGLRALDEGPFDCVFLDYMLEETTGIDVLRTIRQRGNPVPVIALTGCGNEQLAVEAMKLGAQDYLVKGAQTPDLISRSIDNALNVSRLERQLAEQQDELRNFASVAAHDLQAPLRHVRAFADQLARNLGEDLSDRAREDIDVITSSVTRMQTLLDNLLDYARSGRSQGELRPVDLASSVRTAIANLAADIAAKGAQVVVEGELPQVEGDSVALSQLFQNLIGNALKFCGDAPPSITISAREREGGIEVSVADRGIGIAAEHHREVFAPFRRLHSRDVEGSGIGLATCERIVAQHHGKIWVESEPGHGSTFRFTLHAVGVSDPGTPASSNPAESTVPAAVPEP